MSSEKSHSNSRMSEGLDEWVSDEDIETKLEVLKKEIESVKDNISDKEE